MVEAEETPGDCGMFGNRLEGLGDLPRPPFTIQSPSFSSIEQSSSIIVLRVSRAGRLGISYAAAGRVKEAMFRT